MNVTDATNAHDTATECLVEHILDDLSGLPLEQVADALAIAFARHCQKHFQAPGPARSEAYVDTKVLSAEGPLDVRVGLFVRIPTVAESLKQTAREVRRTEPGPG